MNQHHQELLQLLKGLPRHPDRPAYSSAYSGSNRSSLCVATPDLRGAIKEWLSSNRSLGVTELCDLVHSLMGGRWHEEKKAAAYLLGYRKQVRACVSTADLDCWLDDLTGWVEVDCLCQSVFTADEMLAAWDSWQPFLASLARASRIEKRRAGLVFLVMPTRKSHDKRLQNAAFSNIGLVQAERDVLITKAVSWLLRSMVISDRAAVISFLDNNSDTLPKIAIRETLKVLKTGKKTGS